MSLCQLPSNQVIPADTIFTDYEHSHPLTVKNFRAMENGTYWFERLLSIDASWKDKMLEQSHDILGRLQNYKGDTDFDIIYAGGGLAIIHAALMAKVHHKNVCIFDKYAVGFTHRDWNISYNEFLALHDCGLFSIDELNSFIACTYKSGFVKFYDEHSSIKTPHLWMDNVLDNAIDANALLAAAKQIVLEHGGTILESAQFSRVDVNGTIAKVTINHNQQPKELTANVFVDAMGAFSPIAKRLNNDRPFTHCCPTVGTISSGFIEGKKVDEVDFEIGEILFTNEDMLPDGRQLIWEGFPSSEKRFVTYLFFYDAISSPSNKSLLNLYELFFEKWISYKKQGENFDIGRPLFGIIPSFSHNALSNSRITAHDNIISIGDAGALNSPLSYCGFGSFVRNLKQNTNALAQSFDEKKFTKKDLLQINAYEPRVAIMSNFAAFLQGKQGQPAHTVNETMNLFMDVLSSLPNSISQEVFRDTLQWSSYNTMMSAVPKRHPDSYKILIRTHGFFGLFKWLLNFVGFTFTEKRKSNQRSTT